jgi:DNA-binding CsgD family transcriptional regulator
MYRLIPLESFNQAGLPVLAVDTDGTVRFYNRAAADLLCCDMGEGLGRPCWRLARLRCRDGVPFCSRDCPVQREARTHCLQTEHEVAFLSRARGRADFDLLTFLVPPMLRGRWAILHLLRPVVAAASLGSSPLVPPARRAATTRATQDAVIERLHLLSTREREVMQALVDGLDVTSVSDRLQISLTTVRNHIQNILHKLHLHRQVDAILAVLQHESPSLNSPPDPAHPHRTSSPK